MKRCGGLLVKIANINLARNDTIGLKFIKSKYNGQRGGIVLENSDTKIDYFTQMN